MKLLIVPPPYNDESFGGYILRLTELNYYETPKIIYKIGLDSNQRISKNPYKIDPDSTKLKKLSNLVKLSCNKIWSMFLPFSFNVVNAVEHVKKYRTSTQAKYFSPSNRVCTQCLKKYKYIKKYWDIYLVTTCIEHKCYLINECPKCKKQLKYNRKKIEYCDCGLNLCNIQPKHVNNALDLELTSLILVKCKFISGKLNNKNQLNLTSLEEIVESVLTISRSFYNIRYITSPKTSIKDLHNIIIKSYDLFNDWPINYYNFLNKLCKENLGEKFGIGLFGQYYHKIFGPETRHNNKSLILLREGFETFIKTNWDNGNNSLLKRIDVKEEELRFVPLSKAADLLHKSEETIKKYIQDNILKGIIKHNGKSVLYLVEYKSVKEYMKNPPVTLNYEKKKKSLYELDDYISKIDLERILLVCETTIRDLVLEGILNPIKGPEIDQSHTRIFKKEELINFFSVLDSKIIDVKVTKQDLVSIHNARNLINCSFASFIKYIFSSKVKIIKKVSTSDVTINDYYFLKEDVINIFKKEINGLSLVELAALLKVSRSSVENWIDQGFIFSENKHGTKKIIKHSAVIEFKETYIPLVSISIFNKYDGRNTVKKLAGEGVLPVSGPTVNGKTGYLYLRKELNNILI
jgi:TniQ